MEARLRPPNDPDFRLIETCAWRPGQGIRHRDLHLARLTTAARRLGIRPVADVGAMLDGVRGETALRVRLTLDAEGRGAITTAALPSPPPDFWRVGLAPSRLDETNPWRGVKSTERGLYDSARAALPDGLDEVVFLNGQGRFADGTITTLFADFGTGLITPPLSDGALPGVLRASLLASGHAREGALRLADLASGPRLFVGNALRGLIPALWTP